MNSPYQQIYDYIDIYLCNDKWITVEVETPNMARRLYHALKNRYKTAEVKTKKYNNSGIRTKKYNHKGTLEPKVFIRQAQ